LPNFTAPAGFGIEKVLLPRLLVIFGYLQRQQRHRIFMHILHDAI